MKEYHLERIYWKNVTGNIKYDKNTISDMYDSLFTIADYLMKLYKPCKFYPIPKNKPTFGRATKYCFGGCGYYTCCHGCKYLSKDDCTIKNLPCRLYFCGTVRHRYPKLADTLYMLEDILSYYKLSGYFKTKREIIKCHFKMGT